MPTQPNKSQIHVNRPLTNISVAYAEAGEWVADRAFPPVPVSKQSDQYFKYVKGDWMRSNARTRAPATESAGGGWNLETDTYHCRVKAIHKDIADQHRENQDSPLDMDSDATRWTTRQILLARELDWKDAFFSEGVWDTEYDGVDSGPTGDQFLRWDEDDSDPINDVTGAAVDIQGATGYMPNTGVVEPRVSNALRNHPDIIDRIKYTQQGIVTNQLLASLFDLDRFLIASAIHDTGTEGADEEPDFMMDKHMLLVYAAPSPGLMEPSGGYTFVWTGLVGSEQGWQVKRFRKEELEADRVETQSAFDMKKVAGDVAVFFKNAIS